VSLIVSFTSSRPRKQEACLFLVFSFVYVDLFRSSVKWRDERSPFVIIPPLWGWEFQGMRVYRSDGCCGKSAKMNFRAQQHRLDEPTKLSLSMVASLQSPIPFHLADSVYLA
jgi:hypothetical protein